MDTFTSIIKLGAVALIAISTASIVAVLVSVEVPQPAWLGARGEKRRRAIASGGLFAAIEPAVRYVAALCQPLLRHTWTAKLDLELRQAGYYLGMRAAEYVGLMLLAMLGLSALAGLAGCLVDMSVTGIIAGGVLGPLLVRFGAHGERLRRYKAIDRGLPDGIDQASMCMRGGLDFPASIALVASESDAEDVFAEELRNILRSLQLGHTRAHALRQFETRVPIDPVRDFVGTVVQAEEKGTPLAEVLRIQAAMLRMRRSMLAEEAASRAGVMMMIPLLMLLGSILVILMGSLVIESFGSGVV